jgi:hypothetical protein
MGYQSNNSLINALERGRDFGGGVPMSGIGAYTPADFRLGAR